MWQAGPFQQNDPLGSTCHGPVTCNCPSPALCLRAYVRACLLHVRLLVPPMGLRTALSFCMHCVCVCLALPCLATHLRLWLTLLATASSLVPVCLRACMRPLVFLLCCCTVPYPKLALVSQLARQLHLSISLFGLPWAFCAHS